MHTMPDAINDAFIAEWGPRYDDTEHDEPEYQFLVEACRHRPIYPVTFFRILAWKKVQRVVWRMNMSRFEVYEAAIEQCAHAQPAEEVLGPLVTLPGIKSAIASTLLHFCYPTVYPIIDVRTVGVLFHCGYLKYKGKEPKRYPAFREAMVGIQARHPKWSLRQIDRAIFAFHKNQPQIFGQVSGGARRCH